MENGKKAKICVTGGGGFIGSWLVKRLLEDGYSVTTTVRPDPENTRDYTFLTNLPAASERLKIFTADLEDPESFVPAIEGCDGVFHVAAALGSGKNESEETAIGRSVDGALGILKACRNSKTVRRVVYTSSATAVQCSGRQVEVMDESSWSDVDFIKKNIPYGRSYLLTKTLTEKAVLEFAEEHGLDVVTVIPTLVVGPFICPKFPSSVRMSMALILGNEAEYGMISKPNMVHVDDVARAHIFLFENAAAKGRFICSSITTTAQELAKLLSAKYPEFNIPSPESLKSDGGIGGPGISTRKLLDSGFEYKYGVEEIFEGAVQSCREKGFL